MRLLATITLQILLSITSNAQPKNSEVLDEVTLVITNKFKVNSERRLIKQLKTLPVFENSFSGLCVYDVKKEKYVIQYNSDKYFTPASNTKLFTFFSGLNNIDTKIPVLYYVEKNDSLIIWSSGAPTLLYSVFDDTTAFNFLRNTDKNIYFSDSNFKNNHFGLGWAWDDFNDEYSKEVTPLSVYGNAIKVTLFPDGKWNVNPKQFRDSIEVMGYGEKFKIKREFDSNQYKMWLINSTDTLQKEIPFITSTQLSLELLSDSLKKSIVAISKNFGDERIKTLYGIEADSIYKVLLQDSDNYLAESIIMMSSLKLGQNDSIKTSLQIDKILETQLDDLAQKPRWVDGSGLSRYNLFTPQVMVEVLIKIRKKALITDGNMDRVFELLPTGGKTGTLEDRFTNYLPFIYAKTGTLSNNHNLSGYLVTKSGKLLIFSYMNNHYKYKTSTIQKQTDKILEDFYLYY
jgi:D-alanyl-D-alanine carboxypeptidase/D-alanyl-D-alanine-endopeptidase (penicillin-binding protein 4)